MKILKNWKKRLLNSNSKRVNKLRKQNKYIKYKLMSSPKTWADEEELFLHAIQKSCENLSNLYLKEYRHLRSLQTKIKIPVIIIGSFTGITSFGSETFPQQAQKWISIGVGIVSIGIAVLNTIESYFKIGENANAAVNSSNALQQLREDINKELSIPVENRQASGVSFLRDSFTRYQQILSQAPILEDGRVLYIDELIKDRIEMLKRKNMRKVLKEEKDDKLTQEIEYVESEEPKEKHKNMFSNMFKFKKKSTDCGSSLTDAKKETEMIMTTCPPSLKTDSEKPITALSVDIAKTIIQTLDTIEEPVDINKIEVMVLNSQHENEVSEELEPVPEEPIAVSEHEILAEEPIVEVVTVEEPAPEVVAVVALEEPIAVAEHEVLAEEPIVTVEEPAPEVVAPEVEAVDEPVPEVVAEEPILEAVAEEEPTPEVAEEPVLVDEDQPNDA